MEGDISYNHPLYDSAPTGSLNKCQVHLKLCEQRHFKCKVQCRAAIFFSVVNICIELSLYAVAVRFLDYRFSYFKNVSKFIILIRL